MIIDTDFEFGRMFDLKEVRYFVIHHTGVSASQSVIDIHYFHQSVKEWSGIGYHFYIRKKGDIYRGRPEEKQGVHAGPANSESLGICFEGDFNSEQPTDAQMDSAEMLFKYLFDKYGEKPITGHSDHMNTSCPGNFDFDELLGRLEGDSLEKVTVDYHGKNIEGILYEGRLYLPARAEESVRTIVDWNGGEPIIKTRSE